MVATGTPPSLSSKLDLTVSRQALILVRCPAVNAFRQEVGA